jgi:regulator of protease activity HflC (stomatin/prohibitin superfamily)
VGEYVAGTVSLRLQQIDVRVESKTSDNVFVELVVSVQYSVRAPSLRPSPTTKVADHPSFSCLPSLPQVDQLSVYDYFYRLTSTNRQLTSFVFDEVRSCVPKLTLDSVFAQKEEIANSVKESLSESMKRYGITIERSLITEVTPDASVKAAMNSINAAQRERVAAADKAEAAKVREVKAAEAEAEGKYLQGTGIARQRQAIVNGLQESVCLSYRADFSSTRSELYVSIRTIPVLPQVTNFSGETELQAKDTLSILLATQYFDALCAASMYQYL